MHRLIAHLASRNRKPSEGLQAAEDAFAVARRAREEIREQRTPAVLALVARLRQARQENHFRERIEQAFAEQRGAAQ
ncbi:hypothetical protein ACIHCX_03565 [Streptomyces sp. NPDC052043]|uniref:DUF7620 family protein n=1 Tax=Streptomyces sp. NPDC052043 TaxID=3365684 RepID=UPI0037D89742